MWLFTLRLLQNRTRSLSNRNVLGNVNKTWFYEIGFVYEPFDIRIDWNSVRCSFRVMSLLKELSLCKQRKNSWNFVEVSCIKGAERKYIVSFGVLYRVVLLKFYKIFVHTSTMLLRHSSRMMLLNPLLVFSKLFRLCIELLLI